MSIPRPVAVCIALLFVLLPSAVAFAYELAAQNEYLNLYLHPETLALRIEDRVSGYLWSGVIEELVPGENNVSWSNFLRSGLALEYFEANRTRPIRIDLISAKGLEVQISLLEGGFSALLNLTELGLGLQLDVVLEKNSVVVTVPFASLREEGSNRFSSLYLYPFLGATRQDQIPGYLFVPDGIGALIEFSHNQNKFNTAYEERFFGPNEGLAAAGSFSNVRPACHIRVPVFGICHHPLGVDAQGIFAIVEKGQYNARLVAYPNGVITQYNWITAQFMLREAYSQPTSRDLGSGIMVFENRANPEDIQVRYIFNRGERADYVGMAQTYQAYLVEQGVLRRSRNIREQIPLRLDLLGAETENGLFRKNLLVMTTMDQARQILEELAESTGAELFAVYQGWNKGGLSGTNPRPIQAEKKLGGAKGLQALLAWAKGAPVQLHFYADYTSAFREAPRLAFRHDAARRVNKTLLQKATWQEVYPYSYYLTPERSGELMREDSVLYREAGIERLAVEHTPSILFSQARGSTIASRQESAEHYQEGLAFLRQDLGAALYDPNVYLWEGNEVYLNLPLYSSQYAFFDTTVPFLPLVLRGYMDYFAPYSNFFANQEEELLRLMEYGAYPSYYLTWEPAYKLKHTNSSQIFTSTYADWRPVIAQQYRELNGILAQVEGAQISSHTRVGPDLAVVEYSNGKTIVVNYALRDYDFKGMIVPARKGIVLEVKP